MRRLQLSAATHASLEHVLRPLDGYCRRLLRGRVATRASTRVPPRHQLYRATTKSPIVPHECGSSPSSTRLPPRRRRTSSSCRCCRPTTHVSHRFMHRLVEDCKHPAAHGLGSRSALVDLVSTFIYLSTASCVAKEKAWWAHPFTSAAVTHHHYPCRHYRALHPPACIPLRHPATPFQRSLTQACALWNKWNAPSMVVSFPRRLGAKL